jgi:heterodisulfide reductase subunit A-like polyferredoxin
MEIYYCPMKTFILVSFIFLVLTLLFHKMSETKVIAIIGGGLAGVSSAIEAAKTSGTIIHIFEKEKKIGGNSAKASSGIL